MFSPQGGIYPCCKQKDSCMPCSHAHSIGKCKILLLMSCNYSCVTIEIKFYGGLHHQELSHQNLHTISCLQLGKSISITPLHGLRRSPPSIRIFFILLLKDKLLTQEIMIRRHFTITPGCVLCESGTLETAQHLFVTCPVVGQIWCALSSRLNLRMLNPQESICETYLASMPRGIRVQIKTWRTYFICVLWAVWREK
jgi:zinc-binding in reverse transcriptase